MKRLIEYGGSARSNNGQTLTRWSPNRRHYISLFSLTADIFKTPEPNCMIFGALQRRLFLSTHVNSTFINFKTKWRNLATFSNPDFAFDDCYWNFSIRFWSEPLWPGFRVKSTAAEVKIEAVHGLREQQQTGDSTCSKAWRKVLQAPLASCVPRISFQRNCSRS